MKSFKSHITGVIVLSLILAVSAGGVNTFAAEAEPVQGRDDILSVLAELEPGTDYAEDGFIVGFKDHVDADRAAASLEGMDSVAEAEVIEDMGSAVITVQDGENLVSVMESVSENKNVEYVEPDYCLYVMDGSEEDSDEENQDETFGGTETGDSLEQYYLDAINITGLWDLVSEKAVNVSKYAIIDTGCLMTHEDLQTIDKELSVDVTETDSEGNYVKLVDDSKPDISKHGTSIASISSSQSGNGVGIAGVTSCYTNDKVDTFVVGIENSNGEQKASEFVKGIEYAIEMGANVINVSLGTYNDSETIRNAVKKAYDAGIIVICAGGNNGWYGTYKQDSPCYPADYPECISITAVNSLGLSCAYYTGTKPVTGNGYSYGEFKDIACPGTGINCAYATDNSSYKSRNGTSMAGPIAASVVALLFTLNPDLTFADVYRILTESATDVNNGLDVDWTYEGFDPYTGYGLLNAAEAGNLAESEYVPEPVLNGWVKTDSGWMYYRENVPATGWIWDGAWYYLRSDGIMATGWQKVNGIWYYMNAGGAMAANQWIWYNGSWYYMNANGAMAASQWVRYNGAWYYMNSNGKMAVSQWLWYNGSWYYLGANGKMA